jgi:hypothetical protein
MKRLRGQVDSLGVFDQLLLLNEFDLETEFVRRNKMVFLFHTGRFGYYVWKPYLIQRTLSELRDGDVLVFSDVGNHFRPEQKHRLKEYIDIARASQTQIIAPQLSSRCAEKYWTKRELLMYFGVEHNEDLLSSGQFETNFILTINNARSREMIAKWNGVYEFDTRLFDDSRTIPQMQGFLEHRHDQSAFSVLGKLYDIARVPAELDDFVLRLRDKVFRSRKFLFLLFLIRKRLLLHRLLHRP